MIKKASVHVTLAGYVRGNKRHPLKENDANASIQCTDSAVVYAERCSYVLNRLTVYADYVTLFIVKLLESYLEWQQIVHQNVQKCTKMYIIKYCKVLVNILFIPYFVINNKLSSLRSPRGKRSHHILNTNSSDGVFNTPKRMQYCLKWIWVRRARRSIYRHMHLRWRESAVVHINIYHLFVCVFYWL